jgi:hypothetical protein
VSALSPLATAEIGNGCDGGSPLRSSGVPAAPFQHPNGKPGSACSRRSGCPIPVRARSRWRSRRAGQAVIEGLGTGAPTGPPRPAPLGSAIGGFAPSRELKADDDVTSPDPGTDNSPDSTGEPSARVPQPTVGPLFMLVGVMPLASKCCSAGRAPGDAHRSLLGTAEGVRYRCRSRRVNERKLT